MYHVHWTHCLRVTFPEGDEDGLSAAFCRLHINGEPLPIHFLVHLMPRPFLGEPLLMGP